MNDGRMSCGRYTRPILITWLENQVIQQWLRTLAWASVVALLVYLLGALGSSAAGRAAAAAVAIALGFCAGIVTVAGVPELPPERWQWSAWLALASLLLLFLEEARGGQAVLRLVLLMLLVAALEWWVLRPSTVARDWSVRARNVAFYGGGLAALGYLVLAEYRAPKELPWRVGVAATIAAAAAAAVFAVSHASDKVARTQAGLAAALGVCTLVALVQRDVPIGRTVCTTATLAFGSLLAYLWGAQAVPDDCALALLVAWASPLVPLPRKNAWVAFGLSVLLAAIPAWLAWSWATPVSE
jgi:hypothetical protein